MGTKPDKRLSRYVRWLHPELERLPDFDTQMRVLRGGRRSTLWFTLVMSLCMGVTYRLVCDIFERSSNLRTIPSYVVAIFVILLMGPVFLWLNASTGSAVMEPWEESGNIQRENNSSVQSVRQRQFKG